MSLVAEKETPEKADVVPSSTREKKRKANRESQRLVRARQRDYVTHLESLVKNLSSSSSKDSPAGGEGLNEQIQKQYEEIQALRSSLTRINHIAQEVLKQHGGPLDTEDPGSSGNSNPEGNQNSTTSPDSEETINISVTNRRPSRFMNGRDCDFTGASTTIEDLPLINAADGRRPYASFLGLSLDCAGSRDTFISVANRAFQIVESTYGSGAERVTDANDEDLGIRAVVEGWDAAEDRHQFDIAWQLIRALDESIFLPRAGRIERLSAIRVLRATLLMTMGIQPTSTAAVPSFVMPSVAQQNIEHDRFIDYFVWPAIRDQFILTGMIYTHERIIEEFADSVRFIWPYEFRDSYNKVISGNGHYRYSEAFTQAFHNLSSYRLDYSFTSKYFGPGALPEISIVTPGKST